MDIRVMSKLKNYLYFQLSSSFFQIFFVLFAITSIIYLVRIASLTSIIQMTGVELFMLYLYATPNIIFYTLPIVFFVSLAITISRLSSEYETIVITSFGLNPYRIIKIFFPITLIVSITLLIISLGLVPKAKDLSRVFIEKKKNEAKLNIQASQNGQKFGNWLVYIQGEKDEVFYDVTMFKKDQNSKEFITSDKADSISDNSEFLFTLYNGKAFIIKDAIDQINFEKLTLLNSNSQKAIQDTFTNPIDYWSNMKENEKLKKDFALSALISIFPIISMFLVIYIGYFNPRYEKNNASLFSAVSITIFIVSIVLLNKYIPIASIIIIPLVWIIVSYVLLRKYVLGRY